MNRLTKSAAGVMLAMSTLTFFSCEDDAPKVYGLNDAAKYGKITVTFEGTRPDGEDFEKKMIYRFLPEEGLEASEVQEDGDTYFYVQRMHGAVNNSHNDNYVGLYLEVEEETPAYIGFYTETSIVDEDDNTFFYLFEDFSFDPADITSYSYNEESGKLKVKFTTVLDGESNDTGFDLTITADVDVIVFEGLNSGGGEF